jgi:hypothetical protein
MPGVRVMVISAPSQMLWERTMVGTTQRTIRKKTDVRSEQLTRLTGTTLARNARC